MIALEAKSIQVEVKDQLKLNKTEILQKNKEIIEQQRLFIQTLKEKKDKIKSQKINEAYERHESFKLETISLKKKAIKQLKKASEEEEEMIQRLQSTIQS